MTNEDHPDHSNVEIIQNIQKSPGDLARLAVTQSPMKRPSANAGVRNSQGELL